MEGNFFKISTHEELGRLPLVISHHAGEIKEQAHELEFQFDATGHPSRISCSCGASANVVMEP